MNNKVKKALEIMGIVLLFIFLILSIFKGINILFIILVILWGVVFLIAFENEEYYFLGFLASFFVFLIAGDLLINVFNFSSHYTFTEEQDNHAYFSIILALLGLILGYYLIDFLKKIRGKKEISNNQTKKVLFTEYRLSIMRKLSLVVFFVSLFLSLLILIEKVVFINENGFLRTYLGYDSTYPAIISTLSMFLDISFPMYLATMPSKKSFSLISSIYIIYSALTLLTFHRIYFMCNYILIFLYIFYREKNRKKKVERTSLVLSDRKWATGKTVLGLILSLFILIPLMNAVNNTRFMADQKEEKLTDSVVEEVTDTNIVEGAAELSLNQGFSINIIKWGYELEDQLPDKNYLFGDLIDFFELRNQSQEDTSWYNDGNSVEMATKSRKYSHAISYILIPQGYLSGRGAGSSYIAESYHVYGYIGVFLVSLLIGFLIQFFYKRLNILSLYLGFLVYRVFLLMPRGPFSGFILEIISKKNIVFLIYIFLGSYILEKFFKKVLKKKE